MTLRDKTRLIQKWAGALQDGKFGNQTADKIMAKAGITKPKREQIGLVTGSGTGIKRIVIHCAATPEGKDFDVSDIKRWHMNPRGKGGQGWSRIGYHFVIKLDGTIQRGLAENRTGIHVRGRNTGSIAICYIGGVDARMKAKDTRTDAQKASMESLVRDLTKAYPNAKVLGHRDHLGVRKACPSFDAIEWWENVK
jgi:N-acetylmuramoyl-L-alanine amidase